MPYVGKLTGLMALRMDHADVDDEAVKDLNNLTNLQNLSVRRTEISGKALAELKTLQRLNTLELTGLEDVSTVLKRLAGSKNMQKLLISECGLNDDDLKPVATMPNLQCLDISSNHDISNSTMESLSNLRHLKNLSIQRTSITPASLPNIRKLTELRILQSDWDSKARASVQEVMPLVHCTGLPSGSKQGGVFRILRFSPAEQDKFERDVTDSRREYITPPAAK